MFRVARRYYVFISNVVRNVLAANELKREERERERVYYIMEEVYRRHSRFLLYIRKLVVLVSYSLSYIRNTMPRTTKQHYSLRFFLLQIFLYIL